MQVRAIDEDFEIVDETEEQEPEDTEPEAEVETRDQEPTPESESGEKTIDYSKYEQMIAEMKGEKSS